MQPDVDAFLDEVDDGEADNAKGGKGGKGGKGRRRGKAPRLTTEEIHEKFKPGSEIIVQVTKGPISTKGPRVTTNLSIPGRYLVMMPGTKTLLQTPVLQHRDARFELFDVHDDLAFDLVPLEPVPDRTHDCLNDRHAFSFF